MFALVFIYPTSQLFHLDPLEQSVTDINITTFYQLFGVKAFQYFQTVYQNILRDKQNTPGRKKIEIKQLMRLSYCCYFFNHLFMPTVYVTYTYYIRIRILFFENGGLFGQIAAFRSHINGVSVQRIRWLYAQSTRIEMFLENGEIYLRFFIKSKHLREAY